MSDTPLHSVSVAGVTFDELVEFSSFGVRTMVNGSHRQGFSNSAKASKKAS